MFNKVNYLFKKTKSQQSRQLYIYNEKRYFTNLSEIQFQGTFIGVAMCIHNIFDIWGISAAHTYLDRDAVFMT